MIPNAFRFLIEVLFYLARRSARLRFSYSFTARPVFVSTRFIVRNEIDFTDKLALLMKTWVCRFGRRFWSPWLPLAVVYLVLPLFISGTCRSNLFGQQSSGLSIEFHQIYLAVVYTKDRRVLAYGERRTAVSHRRGRRLWGHSGRESNLQIAFSRNGPHNINAYRKNT